MTRLEDRYECRLENNAIAVDFNPKSSSAFKPQHLRITFHRTIRVPDNQAESQLPPSMGLFPLYKIRDYAHRLPPKMAAKGGVFFPMYQREAMWIEFEANRPFMIKIYAGGVNVVSGEPSVENQDTWRRRSYLQKVDKNIQDYVVAPKQYWLDGIATSPGVVRQFVAMPAGSGYSVEAQITGEDTVGGLQVEITPSRPIEDPKYLFVRGPEGRLTEHNFPPSYTISKVKDVVFDQLKIQRNTHKLFHKGKELMDYEILGDLSINHRDTISVSGSRFGKLRGGCAMAGNIYEQDRKVREEFDLAIAPGGKIQQQVHEDDTPASDWIRDITITIPVQILNSTAFCKVTGLAMPPSSVDASAYAEKGSPFFKMYEEPSTVAGDFDAIKSVNEIDQKRGVVQGYEAPVYPRLITIPNRTTLSIHDPDALMNPDGPLQPFRTVADIENELENKRRSFVADTESNYESWESDGSSESESSV
ncbi:hypothetical protein F5Y13DRAFT_189352 [Hypoxylon sp. FL1857]|nr:hypothetical protein F5Y13DRAFT_189352 [Hypoxylon sp. FL1857]